MYTGSLLARAWLYFSASVLTSLHLDLGLHVAIEAVHGERCHLLAQVHSLHLLVPDTLELVYLKICNVITSDITSLFTLLRRLPWVSDVIMLTLSMSMIRCWR